MADQFVGENAEGIIFSTGKAGSLEEKIYGKLVSKLENIKDDVFIKTNPTASELIDYIRDFYGINVYLADKEKMYSFLENSYVDPRPIVDQNIVEELTQQPINIIILYRQNEHEFLNTIVRPRPAARPAGFGQAVVETAVVDTSKMDESAVFETVKSFGPPTKPTPTEDKTDKINDISFAFYHTKDVSYDSVTGEITVTDERTNIFAESEDNDNGHFKVKSGSVSNVTLSIADVIIAIMKKLKKNQTPVGSTNKGFDKFVETTIVTLTKLKKTYSGRDNVALAYTELYGIIGELTGTHRGMFTNDVLTPKSIKSFFIGPSAIKAVMDSCPLGESVLDSIRFNLNSCFETLAVTENDIEQFISIYDELLKERGKKNGDKKLEEEKKKEDIEMKPVEDTSLEMEVDSVVRSVTKVKGWNISKNELIKSIAFWTEIEYCRVFQLISSDIVGAVNGLTPLRAIIDNTAFTGFINIPRGSGGQIGLDNNVCIYSLFLYNVFNTTMLNRDSQNFFGMEKKDYYELIKEFEKKIDQSEEFIRTEYGTSNINQIEKSLHTLMQLLKDESDGVLKGEKNIKSNKFTHMFNIYKIITIFAQFIKDNKDFFTRARDALNASYTGKDSILENSSEITWLCFQLTRYQQTQKVYNDTEGYNIPVEPKPVAVIAYFKERKQMYCEYIKNQEYRNIFIKAWYKALSLVYFYEAFAGHDNNSGELVKFAIDVFDPESGGEFSQFFSQFLKKDGTFSEHPDEVIKIVLKKSNCTIFSELIDVPKKRILWTVGPNSGKMVDKRELGSGKLPVKPPTVSFMSGIITAAKNGNESTICTTIDLAKYLTNELMTSRSEDIVEKLFPSEKLSEEEASILYDNQLVEKSLTLAISKNVNTFYVPSSSTADEAAFDKPQSTIYSTGILRFPIDVGNEITMIVTFRVGIDEATIGTNELYTHTYISPEQLFTFEEMKGDKSPYAVCLAYFYKKSKEGKIPFNEFNNAFKLGPEKKGGIFSNLKYDEFNKTKNVTKEIVLTLTATLYDRYKAFLKFLLINVIQNSEINIRDKNYYYYLFLTVAIPSISSLQSKDIFTAKSGVGGLWRNLIFTIAGDNINVALNFIATIESIPEIYDNPDKAIKRNIDACKEYFTALFERIKGTTPKFPAFFNRDHLIAAELQVEFSKSEKTICLRTVENGRPVLKLASIEEILDSSSVFIKIIEEERAKENLEVKEELAPRQLTMLSGQTASQTPSENSRIVQTVLAFDEMQTGQPKRTYEQYIEGPNKAIKFDDKVLTNMILNINVQIQVFLGQIRYIRETLEPTEQTLGLIANLETAMESFLNNKQIFESMLRRSSGGGQIGGDDEADYEEIYKLEAQLAELKAQLDELLINMVTFTTGPISDLEISKTAALLGPELFEKIAQAQNQEIIEEYNKIFALNAGNVPFGENNEVEINPADEVSDDTNIADVTNNELVMVNYVDGKYHIESADKFFQSFLENYQEKPTVVEGAVENATAIATETVAKGVETVKEVADSATEKVEESVENVKEATANVSRAAANAASEASTKVVEVAANVGEAVSNASEQVKDVFVDAVDEAKEYIKPASVNPAAAAAGGYKKQTKKKRNNIKKFTKHKRSKSNSKSKKYTRRKNSKKPKKTKRKN